MKSNKHIFLAWISVACFALMFHSAHAYINDTFRYPFYLGLTGGYGATTWNGLVPPKNKQNFAMAMSAPVKVHEGGFSGGMFAGYEFLPVFAVEFSYMRYPNATVVVHESSLITDTYGGLTQLETGTETVALMGKIMLVIPTTSIRAYSSAGIAGLHRWDQVNDQWRATPTFGAGFNYNFTDNYMVELGGVYTAGYGESELSPIEDYMPFLYAVFLRFGVRF